MAQRYLIPLIPITLDANGNGVIQSERMQSWSKVSVSCWSKTLEQLNRQNFNDAKFHAGSGISTPSMQWNVGIGIQNALISKAGIAIGKAIISGSHILAQGEFLVIEIKNGTPGDEIQGLVSGIQMLDPSELGTESMLGDTRSVDHAPGMGGLLPTYLGSLAIGLGASGSFTATIPPYTTFIRLYADTTFIGLTVTGVTSGRTYINLTWDTLNLLGGYYDTLLINIDPRDTQVTIAGTTQAALTGNLQAWAFSPPYFAGLDRATLVQFPLSYQQGTWTTTSVATPAGNGAIFTIQAANPNRRGLLISNFANSGALLIRLTGITSFLQLPLNGYWEMPSPISTVQIDGVTTAAGQGGSVQSTEIT